MAVKTQKAYPTSKVNFSYVDMMTRLRKHL